MAINIVLNGLNKLSLPKLLVLLGGGYMLFYGFNDIASIFVLVGFCLYFRIFS